MTVILPAFARRGESDALLRALKRRPRYGAGMRDGRPLHFSFLVGLLFSISAAAYAESSKKPGEAAQTTSGPQPERLGAADVWTAYAYSEKTGKVCYLAGAPKKSEPAGGKRKPPVAMVTHRPGERITNVVSFVEGYPLKEGSEVSLDIAGAKFDLFAKGDSAWARTPELDKSIVEAMTKGKQAVVKGTPQKGPTTTDTYSLAGFTQALALIDKACDVKR
jgi:Invasion associated locus B (IalB) protein